MTVSMSVLASKGEGLPAQNKWPRISGLLHKPSFPRANGWHKETGSGTPEHRGQQVTAVWPQRQTWSHFQLGGLTLAGDKSLNLLAPLLSEMERIKSFS